MATKDMTTEEMYTEMKTQLKEWQKKTGVKLSITRPDYNVFCVAFMKSKEELATESYFSINHYYLEEDHRLTPLGLRYAKEIKDIVFLNHYDYSDSQTDYFHAAFYFKFSVGKYEKPYQVI